MENELDALQGLVTTATGFVAAYGFQTLGAVIILVVGIQVAKWVAGLVVKLCERKGLDITLARFFGSITKVGVLTFVGIIALGKFGITIAPFIAALGAIAFGTSLILPRDTGHRVKDHIMIRNEVIDEKATQEP